MRINRFLLYLLFILFALYFAQGLLYSQSSIISKTCLLLILLISGSYFIKTLLIKNKKNPFYNAWTLLLLLNSVGFITTADYSNSSHVTMFKNILICSLSFYPFYYFTKKEVLLASDLVRFFSLMLPIFIFQFFLKESRSILESNKENVVNNMAFLFVNLIPFVFLIKKKIIATGLMLLIMAFIIKGASRGAVISGAIGLLMFFYYQLRMIEKGNRVKGYLIATVAIAILSFFAYRTFISNEFLLGRMNAMIEGDSSGRTLIYAMIFNSWYTSESIWNIIFGYGFAGSLKLTHGAFAHNDWFELLSNFGLVGIGIYLNLFYVASKLIIKKGLEYEKWFLMLTITLIWFFLSMVSMWYYAFGGYTQAILFAYLVGYKLGTEEKT